MMFFFRTICLIVSFFTLGEKIYCQKVILDERFDHQRLNDSGNFARMYVLDPYVSPSDPAAFNLYADRNDGEFSDFFTDNRCTPDTIEHGFYTGILVFDRHVPSTRSILTIRLDSLLPSGRSERISIDLLYHKFTEYRIDSLQALFLHDKSDIKAWFAERPFRGQYVRFSLAAVDNRSWKQVSARFVTEGTFGYLLIGNLKKDEDCTVTKANNCDCCPRPRHKNWSYSELLMDNILITTDEK